MFNRYWLLLLLYCLSGASVGAQTLLVYNVDPARFPRIRADFVLFDAAGNRIQTVDPADFEIIEDGLPGIDITASCPPFVPPQPFHAVLVNDRSGSMSVRASGAATRMDLAKLGSREFVLMTNFSGGATIAVTSFASSASIVIDFQRSAVPLLDAINTISADGGTLYNPPFLDPIAGAIGMLSSRRDGLRRVLVFLTDGEPNEATRIDDIVNAANNAGVDIYPVTVAMPMTRELEYIAQATGGTAFGNINEPEQIRAVYQQIAASSGGSSPCAIAWSSRVRCGSDARNRTALIRHKPTGATARVSFLAPHSSVAGLETSPMFMHFGAIGPPETADRQVVVTSLNDTMRIDRVAVVPEGAFTVVDWGGEPPPFQLAPRSSRTITVRFTPADSQKYVASLVLYGAPCPPHPVTLTGGVGDEDGASIRLLSPVGGERFSGCDSILIRWAGVAETTPVDLDASSDDGATWTPVASRVTGLMYRWMPPMPGAAWRVRVTAPEGRQQNLISTVAGGGNNGGENVLATDAVMFSPTGVAVRGDSMYIAEAGMHRIRRVDLTTGRIVTIAGDGNPGYNSEVLAQLARLNAPMHVLIEGNYLFFADHGNHRVRQINLTDGRIALVAGTGESGSGGDGGNAQLAQLQYPSYLALYGTMLYVTDAGNARVRRIDLGARTISTVAGGGTSTVDGIQATTALLDAPAGIAVDERYLYIAEARGRRVRRVELSTGIIRTIAGTGMAGSSGDGGQASVATFMHPVGVELYRDQLYITDSGAHRVRRVDLVTGVITSIAGTGAAGYGGDGADARLARLNAPGQPAAHAGSLYVPDIQNNRIRAISVGMGPGSDSSASAFSVNVAGLRVTGLRNDRFAFGAMALGQSVDSAVADALCSVGSLPLFIDSARVVGAHASDFAIVAGARSGELLPGACTALEVRFRPSGIGARNAMAILYGRCANADTVLLSGIGIDSCGIASLDLADVGQIILGSGTRDTLVERAICNTESRQIAGNARVVNGSHVFAIVSGGGAFVLDPGACHTVTIRFSPVASGRVTGEIDYGIPTTCGVARTRLIGRALGAPELAMPGAIAFGLDLCDTDRDTSITIINTGGAPLEITSAAITSNDEGFALLGPIPTPGAPLIVPPGDSTALRLRFAPASVGGKSAILELVTNASETAQRIALTGRRDMIAIASDRVLSVAVTGALPQDTVVEVRNEGTVAVTIIDAELSGSDAASFVVPNGQLPAVAEAGGTVQLRLQMIAAPDVDALRATLRLRYAPACGLDSIAIEIVAAGTGPELLTIGPEFRALICPDEMSRDTTVWLRNDGSSTLVISDIIVENDPRTPTSFSIVGELPETIELESSEDTLITVRFAGSEPGLHTGALRITSNARERETLVPLNARRDRIDIRTSQASIRMGPVEVGGGGWHRVDASNAGTLPTHFAAVLSRGDAMTLDLFDRVLDVNESAALYVRFNATRGGIFYDTLLIRDELCGTIVRVPIELHVTLRVVTEVALPNDTVRPAGRVTLPIRITILDDAAFAASGARDYTTEISMYGTVLVPDSVDGAEILSNEYDLMTRKQTIVLRGVYSPTRSASILAYGVLGDTLGTPLHFESFEWDKPIGTRMIDGSVSIVGNCLDIGIRMVAVPQIVKVRPMPAADRVTLELSLEEWQSVRVVLYDARGIPVTRSADRVLDAGARSLQLDVSTVAPGVYTLAVETVYGRSALQVVVAR